MATNKIKEKTQTRGKSKSRFYYVRHLIKRVMCFVLIRLKRLNDTKKDSRDE